MGRELIGAASPTPAESCRQVLRQSPPATAGQRVGRASLQEPEDVCREDSGGGRRRRTKESVTITGSGFMGVSSVQFNGTEAPFSVVSDTRIRARVPSGAGIGPIRVPNPAGEDVSDTDFQFRRISHRVILKMHLEGHLQAIGRVTFPHVGARARIVCGAGRRVRIQREISGVFRSVGQGETEAEGRFLAVLDDRKGEYRAVIKMKRTPNRKCLPDRSLVRTHEHT